MIEDGKATGQRPRDEVPRAPPGAEPVRRDEGTAEDAGAPTRLTWSGWWAVLTRVRTAVTEGALWIHCGCVGFFGFLSLFPILGLFVLLYGLLFDPADIEGQVETLRALVPVAVFDLLVARLAELTANTTRDLTFGVVLTVAIGMWTGSRGVNAIVDLLNLAYHEPMPRSFLRRAVFTFATTFAATLAVAIVLITVAALPVLIGRLGVGSGTETLALWGRWPVLAAFIFAGLVLLFRHGPHRRAAKVRWVAPGAAVSTILWIALSFAFSAYVERSNFYGATFGTVSVAAVLMFWIYYSALALAIGAILNAELELQTRADSTRGRDRPRGERRAVVADRLPKEVREE
ncbi:MAG: YihY/virulence factor BrkB family protein [Pseudomonadota bacterium]